MVKVAVPSRNRADLPRDPAEFRLPLFLFGVGLGGFVDGILLHQILQWHHMLSNTSGAPTDTVMGLEKNTLADGLFHAFAWLVVLIALHLTMRTKRRDAMALLPSRSVVIGWLLIGWARSTLWRASSTTRFWRFITFEMTSPTRCHGISGSSPCRLC